MFIAVVSVLLKYIDKDRETGVNVYAYIYMIYEMYRTGFVGYLSLSKICSDITEFWSRATLIDLAEPTFGADNIEPWTISNGLVRTLL